MKILIVSIGTRGDMEPFLAIGELLKERGHEVICAFPEQFRSLAEDSDIKFASLGSKFIEMIESDVGKAVMGGGGSLFKKIIAYWRIIRMQGGINQELISKQFDIINRVKPDRVVHHGKALYPVMWELENKGKTIYVSPVPFLHYVKNNTHLAFNSNYGEYFNKLTYKLADWGLVKTILSSAKRLNVKNVNRNNIKSVLENHKIVYSISPSLFPRQSYWKENINVLGYHERVRTNHWKPNLALLDFLDQHERIVFVTFGSMANPDPVEKTRVILNILKRNGIPAIINIASGGLQEPDSYDKNLFYFVSNIPYEWIFPKMYAVIHHGGSGTTHMTLKYGCASMIIPHIIDQFVWNKLLHSKKVGPLGIKLSRISERKLEPLILDLMSNESYKLNAKEIASHMAKESYLTEELYEVIVGENR